MTETKHDRNLTIIIIARTRCTTMRTDFTKTTLIVKIKDNNDTKPYQSGFHKARQ